MKSKVLDNPLNEPICALKGGKLQRAPRHRRDGEGMWEGEYGAPVWE